MKTYYLFFVFLVIVKTNCAIEPADWTPEDLMLPNLPEIQLVMQASEPVCPVVGCQYNPKRKSDLARHIRFHTGDKPYACTERGCKYRATEKSRIQSHIESHFNKQFVQLEEIAKIKFEKIKDQYKCNACGYCIKDKSHMEKHMRVHTKEKPFACPVIDCIYRATQKEHISSHLKRHSGEKPYRCTYDKCDYRAAHKNSLVLHMRHKHED